jgi:hypothetical protein
MEFLLKLLKISLAPQVADSVETPSQFKLSLFLSKISFGSNAECQLGVRKLFGPFKGALLFLVVVYFKFWVPLVFLRFDIDYGTYILIL